MRFCSPSFLSASSPTTRASFPRDRGGRERHLEVLVNEVDPRSTGHRVRGEVGSNNIGVQEGIPEKPTLDLAKCERMQSAHHRHHVPDWTSTGLDYYRTRDLVARDTNLGVENISKKNIFAPTSSLVCQGEFTHCGIEVTKKTSSSFDKDLLEHPPYPVIAPPSPPCHPASW